MRRLVWVVLAVVSLVAGGCSSSGGEESVRAEEGGGTNVSATVLVACSGDGPGFPVSVFDGPADAEESPDGEALRAFLADASPDSEGLPDTGWRRLFADDAVVLYGAGEPPEIDYVEMAVEGGNEGRFSWGSCPVRPYREGFEPATWEPDGAIDGTATEVAVLVTETGCASGQAPGDRLQPAEVVEDGDRVVVSFWVEPPGGSQDCPGNPATPVTVTLAAPLGGRELADGGAVPARVVRPATETPETTAPDPATPIEPDLPDPGGPTATTGSVPGDAGPAGDQAAAAEIDAAFHAAFDAEVPEQERFAAVEDGEALAEAGREAAARFPTATASITVTVHEITVDGGRATVAFELLYDDAMPLGVQQGEAVLVDGAWKVGRETRCAIIRQAGVDCP